jgi:hypothetical protein
VVQFGFLYVADLVGDFDEPSKDES